MVVYHTRVFHRYLNCFNSVFEFSDPVFKFSLQVSRFHQINKLSRYIQVMVLLIKNKHWTILNDVTGGWERLLIEILQI